VNRVLEETNGAGEAPASEVGLQKSLGFQLYTNNLVRSITQGVYAVKLESGGSNIVENKDGNWKCDCGKLEEECPHIYAAQLMKLTNKDSPQFFDGPLKCRYCGSPDLRGCGYRYGARGIAHRYFCNECNRKFSIKHRGTNDTSKAPTELLLYLNEVGPNLSRLNDLLDRINKILQRVELTH
jgi:hypothetical protein